MNQILIRLGTILLASAASSACAAYEAPKPAYPIRLPAAQPAPYAPAPPAAARPPAAAESRMQESDARPLGNAPGYVTPSTPPGDYGAPPPPPVAAAPPAPPPRPAPPRYRTVTKTSVTGTVVEVDGPRVTYAVKKGDNLEKIARSLELDWEDLAKDNKLKPPYRLQPGQVLKGPPTKQKAYVVGSGDTLSQIARRFSVTAKALGDENDLGGRALIRPGQRLRLPNGYRDTGAIKTVTQEVIESPPTPRQAYAAPPPRPVYTPPTTAYAAPTPAYTAPAPAYTPSTPAYTAAAPAPTAATERPPTVVYTAPTPPPAATPSRPQPYATPTPRPTYPTPPAPAPAAPTQMATRPSYPLPPPPPASSPPRPSTNMPAGPVIAPSPAPTASQISELGRGRFLWPVRGDIVMPFGPKGQGLQNDGVNIRAPAGEPVRAAAAGDVVYAGDQVPGFGNLVLIKHAEGWVTAYGHLARSDVKMQQRVTQGQQIGTVGSTGGTTEPQLHFEIRYAPTPADRAKPFDPILVLPR